MEKTCAYCIMPLTKKTRSREHIIPNGLLKITPNSLNYQRDQKKFLKESLIGDVCVNCNQGVLSSLDQYVIEMYKAQFCHLVEANQAIQFTYEFDQLVRWLLKVSYNAARFSKIDTSPLKECVPYIIGKATKPLHLTVFVQLIAPITLSPYERATTKLKRLEPLFIRPCHLNEEVFSPHFRLARMMELNSYCFYMLLPRKRSVSNEQWEKSCAFVHSYFNGLQQLTGENQMEPTTMTLRTSSQSLLDVLDHSLWFDPAFKTAVDRDIRPTL